MTDLFAVGLQQGVS